MPSGAPGRPTFVRPVRIGDCPVMKAARPAVQLCWPYQSVKIAPSARDPVNIGSLIAHHALVVGTRIPVADVVSPDDDNVGLVRGIGRNGQPSTEKCDDNKILHSSVLDCHVREVKK